MDAGTCTYSEFQITTIPFGKKESSGADPGINVGGGALDWRGVWSPAGPGRSPPEAHEN